MLSRKRSEEELGFYQQRLVGDPSVRLHHNFQQPPFDPVRGSPLKARTALLAVSALLAVTMASCGSFRRAGKDVFVGVASPILIVYGGATDGYGTAKGVRDGLGSGSAVEVLAFPFTFLFHATEHAIYCAIHVLDLPFTPFYMMAEIPPGNVPIQPLDFYQGTWFDGAKTSGTDATSGEATPPGFNR